jgi:hypothetical protein
VTYSCKWCGRPVRLDGLLGVDRTQAFAVCHPCGAESPARLSLDERRRLVAEVLASLPLGVVLDELAKVCGERARAGTDPVEHYRAQSSLREARAHLPKESPC